MTRFPGLDVLRRLVLAVIAVLMLAFPALAAPFAALVMDARSGEVLYSENADTRLHPASLTKMMTLYIAFEAIERGEISLDTKVSVSQHAANQPPSRLGLKPGQKIALRYLIRAAAIKSANDAATAIGEAIGGNEAEFARRMTRTAQAIGMKNSTFRNANGLTAEGHLSTARDMTILGRRLFYDFPQYYNIFSRRSADAGIAQVASTNRKFLDAYEGADGIKTGYTVPAGFNLTASAQRGNKRIVATVLGGRSTAWRNEKMAELLDLGFARAPGKATVQKPAAPVYADAAPAEEVEDGLPETPDGAGKTLRLQVAVAKSIRPRPRPGAAAPPPEVLTAMQDNIDAVLAEVHAEGTGPAADDEEAIETAAATSAAPAPAVRPAARPAQDAAAQKSLEQLAVVPASAPPARPAPAPVEQATAGAAETQGEVAPVMMQSTAPQPETIAMAAESGLVSQPSTIMLMSAQPEAASAPAAEQEVVSRASTSGGRQWGISLGNFNSRYQAERELLQMALTEPNTLDGTLRKVVNRKGGFDATFMGMTHEMAQAACRRMTARGKDCSVVGP